MFCSSPHRSVWLLCLLIFEICIQQLKQTTQNNPKLYGRSKSTLQANNVVSIVLFLQLWVLYRFYCINLLLGSSFGLFCSSPHRSVFKFWLVLFLSSSFGLIVVFIDFWNMHPAVEANNTKQSETVWAKHIKASSQQRCVNSAVFANVDFVQVLLYKFVTWFKFWFVLFLSSLFGFQVLVRFCSSPHRSVWLMCLLNLEICIQKLKQATLNNQKLNGETNKSFQPTTVCQ